MIRERRRHVELTVTPVVRPVRFVAKPPEASKMSTREDDLHELAQDISTAIEKARQLNLPTSAYILSMVLVELSEALKAAADEKQEEDDAAP
jgi:hypothetical protein